MFRQGLALVAIALFVAACSDDKVYVPPDLSSPLLYCPTDPPMTGTPCAATATPYCDYGVQSLTCKCVTSNGVSLFECGPLEQPDEGTTEGA